MRAAIYSLIFIIIIALIVIILSLTGNFGKTDNDLNNEASDLEEIEINFKSLFPNGPYGWYYVDNSNYVKVMAIQEIYENHKEVTLVIEGQEEDTFSKFVKNDKNFEIKYDIREMEIIESMRGNSRNDYFDKSIILKKPIFEGSKWSSIWVDNDGNKVKVNCEITAIEGEGAKIVVKYSDDKKTFTEERTFEIGKGIVALSRHEKFEGMEYELSYNLKSSEILGSFGLYEYFDYLKNDVKETFETAKSGTNEVKSNLAEESEKNDSKSDIENVIRSYSEAWISYVNDKSEDVFLYLVPSGSAYNIIKNFDSGNMHQEILELKINRIIIKGNIANAYVYEKGKYEKDGLGGEFEYNWIYEMNQIDGNWLIQGYRQE